ncbi:MAG: serine hydrolase domain-containing protein, partial [Chthoniobacter sp.]|uniref:serine hydrolase domain-containing protein n=1 Tax=Chthoniobacter sp. TaxID=2510640 RepID=UPI0032A14CCD
AFIASALTAEPRDISPELEAVRAKYKLPACASAVIEDGQITAIGATGLRRVDRDVRVTTADLWHIGSCTKSMTATLIGVLVDAGQLRWDTPVSDIFPGVPCHPGWRKVTVWHLVTQRSGIGSISRDEWRSLDAAGGSPREQRANFARLLLAHAPLEPPGKFTYSNIGYGLLGAIIERASGKSFEDFLRTRIFVPLGLKTADFGAPATPGQLDQPWGHRRSGDRLTPVEPTPENQFPPALAPAACVHMSLTDFARYVAWISTGQPRIVKPETFAQLQTPPEGSSYAGGLWKTELPGIGGAAVCHTGHLGGFFAVFYASAHGACVAVFNTEGGGWEWLGDVIAATALKAAR